MCAENVWTRNRFVFFLKSRGREALPPQPKKLFISVPGLVKSMDKLEDELGAPLFVRQRTGVCLSPAGRALEQMAPAYLRQTETIRAEVIKAACDRDAQAEVCMTWGLLSFFPANFLSRFVLSHPKINLCTRNDTIEGCYARVASGKSAIALVFGAVNDPALEVVFHRESTQVALLSEKHPLARKQELCMADFAPYRLVLLNSTPHVIGSLERQCAAAGCAPQIMLDGGAWGQAIELVAKANYVSFCLPPKTMKEEKLVTRPVRDLDLTINFNMAVLRGAALSAAESEFVDYVVRVMQREG